MSIFAQSAEKEVVILVKGSGSSVEIAKQNALRSALEQAYGAFFTAKTEIFNDQVIVDQMISISSGNIKSYKILNEDVLPDGRFSLTVQAFLSIDKLSTFVKSKGVEVEFNGGMFALNVKQQILNEEAEMIAISDMVGVLHKTMQSSFDYNIEAGNPMSSDDNNQKWKVPIIVTARCNENADFCANYLIKTLKSFSLNNSEIESYKSLGKAVFKVTCVVNGEKNNFYLRNRNSFDFIHAFVNNISFYVSNFSITDVKSGSDYFDDIANFYWSQSLKNNSFFTEGFLRIADHVKLQQSFFSRDADDNLVISFVKSGNLMAKLDLVHPMKLAEIEKLSGYRIESKGEDLNYSFGLGGVIVRSPWKTYKLGMSIQKSRWSNDLIATVLENGPAYKAGIRSGDVIIEISPSEFHFFENEIDGNLDIEAIPRFESSENVKIKVKSTYGEKEYSVKPEFGIKSGLVVSMIDIKNVKSREMAIESCENLDLNGFRDWRAPYGYDEIDRMKSLVDNNVWAFDIGDVGYWSLYKPFRNQFYYYNTTNDREVWTFYKKISLKSVDLENRSCNVRPVRTFYTQP